MCTTSRSYKVALEQLSVLDQQQLWQQGKVKEFHIALTDILREYLHNYYGIEAQEMVSREILNAIKTTEYPENAIDMIEKVLRIADLVKFAKGLPSNEENQWSFEAVKQYIDSTHPP